MSHLVPPVPTITTMAYTKLFASIITSTIWMEPDQTRIVWITMLAAADKNGEVQGSIPGLARIAGVPVEAARESISKFLSPDPDSRTKDDEGRRIEAIDGGWRLLNHRKYREMASRDEARESEAKRKAAYRAKIARNAKESGTVRDMSTQVPVSLHIAEADTEADTKDNTTEARAEPVAVVSPVDSVVLYPDPLDTPEFRAAWADWTAYRRERRIATLKPRSVIAQLAKLATWGHSGAIASIRQSIEQNYQGLFEPRTASGRPEKTAGWNTP